MSALEYLSELRGSRVLTIPGHIFEDRITRFPFLRDYWESHGTVVTTEFFETYLRSTLVEPLLASLPAKQAAMLTGIHVGVLPTADPNAWVIRTPSDDLLVVLNSELLLALSFYKEVQMATFELTNANKQAEVVELRNEAMKIVDLVFQGRRAVHLPIIDAPMSEKEYVTVQATIAASEMFIIAHEFAHVVLGHLGEPESMSVKFASRQTKLSKYNWSQREELDADVQAFRWLYRLKPDVHNEFVTFVTRMPLMAVEFLMMFHFSDIRLRVQYDATSSHPSPLDRLVNLGARCKKLMSLFERRELKRWISSARAYANKVQP